MESAVAREAVVLSHLTDPSSAYYRSMCAMLRATAVKEKSVLRAKQAVQIPFAVDSGDVAALEAQFAVRIKTCGAVMRARTSPRVAGMVHCVDEALVEHAGGFGRRVMAVDGDLVTLAVRGLDGRSIERTGATARLVAGYAMEDAVIQQMALSGDKTINNRARVLWRELRDGGGEHFQRQVQENGAAVDAIVVNHFRTPAGPHQMAWLAYKRRAPVYGAFPFQVEMLVKDEGELDCFPGRYYVDRGAGNLTLVPSADATMSLSFPFSCIEALATNNSVTVAGQEFLLERYMQVGGLLYYTLKHVDSDFEAPEVLRSYYFSPKDAEVTELRFPKVRFSSAGVPVGWMRGTVRILTSRYNSVLLRVQCSANKVVRPAEVFSALMDSNNLVINTLDTTVLAERMDVQDQQDAAVAIALHVNQRRHMASGTLGALLRAVKVRHVVAGANVGHVLWLAMTAWLSRPDVEEVGEIDDLASISILDWCGNDFGVVVADVDPWLEIVQEAGTKSTHGGKFYLHLPKPEDAPVREYGENKRSAGPRWVGKGATAALGLSPVGARTVGCVTTTESVVAVNEPVVLSDLKVRLKSKMMREQAAAAEVAAPLHRPGYAAQNTDGIGECPVIDAEPISTIRADMVLANGGPMLRDAVATGYRLAEVDIYKETHGNITLNDAKRIIPKGKYVRRPLVDAGVEGYRASCQATLVGAAFKRNVGIPNNREAVNLDLAPEEAVSKVIASCFVTGWEQKVAEQLGTGMWQPTEGDIEDYLHGLEPQKAKAMVDEFFCEGAIKLDRWLLMAKGKVKTSREPGSQLKVDHAQTIMYLESKSTNALFSSVLRRAKKCLDSCLRPEVSLNPQRNDADHEEWDNSLNELRASFPETYKYVSDIRCYDRAQEHMSLLCVMAMYKRLGLDKRTMDRWKEMHGEKKAYSMMFGVILSVVMCGISGNWETLMRNGMINLIAVVLACGLSYRDIVALDIKGDDMYAEFSRKIDVEQASQLMGSMFNLSAKISRTHVGYMCKQFRLRINGRIYHVADPWPKVQSLCTPLVVGGPKDPAGERWESLADGLRHYDNGILVEAVAEAAQVFYGIPGCFHGMARGLAAVKKDRNCFYRMFGAPELVQ